MFFEGWFRIGDTVAVDALHVQGVVESVSLRSLRLRSITGEILYVPNSQVNALRVIPRGYREVEIEFFTTELEAGEELVEKIAQVVPVGPTRFIRRPTLLETETLDEHLYRITARCAVTAGREWLVQELLPSLLKERAAEGLLVHGPIITYVDEQASHSFARAMGRATDR
jgi:small-conductance mechanosensitive channel